MTYEVTIEAYYTRTFEASSSQEAVKCMKKIFAQVIASADYITTVSTEVADSQNSLKP